MNQAPLPRPVIRTFEVGGERVSFVTRPDGTTYVVRVSGDHFELPCHDDLDDLLVRSLT